MSAPTTLRPLRNGDRQVPIAPIPMVPCAAGYEHLTQREKVAAAGVASREALLERLETVGSLAPEAPLSFLVVHVGGLGYLDDAETGSRALTATIRTVAEFTGPLDLAGRFGASGIGIMLQGRGARAAAAIAARLQWRLQHLPEIRRPLYVEVYAATGTGRNAPSLPTAAAHSLPEVG